MAAYTMSQGDLYLVLPLAWQHYTDNQEAFGRYKKNKYTATLGTEAIARVEAAMKIPSYQARGAMPEATRVELEKQTDEFLDVWNLLDGYIEEAYKESNTYKAKREAAGYKLYAAAANGDWGAANDMVTQALGFVEANRDTLLTQGDMADDFEATLKAEGGDVQRVVRRYLKEQEDAEKGTDVKVTANEVCFAEYQSMSADAQRIFRQKPEVARLFQAESLLSTVRGTRQAGIRGVVTDADGQDVVGATVTVKGVEGASAVTDEDGRYFIPLAIGTYTVVVSREGLKEQEIADVVVEVGVRKRVDVGMEAAPESEVEAPVAPPAPLMDDADGADEEEEKEESV